MSNGVERVAVLSLRVGGGHIRAAEALATVIGREHPGIQVKQFDGLDYTNAVFRKTYTWTYDRIATKLPALWGMIYGRLEKKQADSGIKRFTAMLDRLNARRMLREVEAFAPDRVICTHYLPAEVMAHARVKGRCSVPVSVVLTDYDIHTMWVQQGVDRYYVASEEMEFAMHAKGIGDAHVRTTGIPIVPEFSEDYPDKTHMRLQLGLRPDVPVVLVSAGGFGFVKVDEVVGALADAIGDVQLIAIAGRDEKLHKALVKQAPLHGDKITPLGFVTNMHELMAASDLAVSKCGGLTSSECLAMGLPMVIVDPIPGQEERNSDYLLENGAALRANSPAHLVHKVGKLLADTSRRERMREAIRKIARPRAAYDIVDDVLSSSI